MVLEKKDAITFKSSDIDHVVTSRVPAAKLLTDVGMINLLFLSYALKQPFGVGTEIAFQLPFSSSDRFQGLFDHLDANLDELGIRSYGMSVTTLEEVFIKVAEGTATEATAVKGRKVSLLPLKEEKSVIEESETQKRPTVAFSKLEDEDMVHFFFQHMYALIMKRILYFRRDFKTWVYQFFIPVLFVLVGMIILLVSVPVTYQPSITLQPSLYNPGITVNRLPFPYSDASTFTYTLAVPPASSFAGGSLIAPSFTSRVSNQSTLMDVIPGEASFPVRPVLSGNTIGNMSQYLLDHRADFKASLPIGAYTFIATSYSFVGVSIWSSLFSEP